MIDLKTVPLTVIFILLSKCKYVKKNCYYLDIYKQLILNLKRNYALHTCMYDNSSITYIPTIMRVAAY